MDEAGKCLSIEELNITNRYWTRIGKVPLDKDFNKSDDEFRYDAFKNEFRIVGDGYPPNGIVVPKEKILGLEC